MPLSLGVTAAGLRLVLPGAGPDAAVLPPPPPPPPPPPQALLTAADEPLVTENGDVIVFVGFE